MQNPEFAENLSILDAQPGTVEPTPDPTPNDPPWGSWIAIGVFVVSVLLILILPSFFLIGYLGYRGIPIAGNPDLKDIALGDPMAVLVQLISIFPAHILTLSLCWLVVTRGGSFGFFKTLGFGLGGFRFWHFAAILIGVFACLIAVSRIFPEQDNDMLRMLHSSRSAVYLLTIMATFGAPIVEEVVYRGVMYSAFQRSLGTIAAVLAVTFLFAGVHYAQYWGSPGTIIMITILSLVLTLVRMSSRNLLPCIILHFLFNGLQSVVILKESLDPVAPATALLQTLNR